MTAALPRVAVVDYGLANIRSVVNALSCFDADVTIAETGRELGDADLIVLPGVGSFDAGMEGLAARGHAEALEHRVREAGVPYLGICLGMHFLFSGSEEGVRPGLGWLDGSIVRFPAGEGHPKVPHVGWSAVEIAASSKLMAGLASPSDLYFVHGYHAPLARTADITTGICEYGLRFCAALEWENVAAVQFHPEKSQLAGMKLLETFVTRPR
ncbi:MAG: imidazole glycerol phosphate synthase subunit HisH [Deltaproteobacteria bacterium]|nr:imidazole glycerol phosphate synthase subunit HisH [Deltaproteobacteria bacterium]